MHDQQLKSDVIKQLKFVDGHSDVWRLFYDGDLFARIVEELVRPFRGMGVTKIAGIEARGFILGAAAAATLNVGFVAIRKSTGLYPGPKIEITTEPDYESKHSTLRLQRAAIVASDKVLLVDDWFETGSQALVAKALIEEAGGALVGASIIVDQLNEPARQRLGMLHVIVKATELVHS